ncbi:MAG TPA: glycoside hydrolase family 44 protein [Terriglobales bacterium]
MCWFACVAQAQNPAVTINVDVQANRHAINPLVYGVNLFENLNVTTILQDLNAPINRYGGNRASTYNWITNSDNRGNDYYFESISDDNQTTGERVDTFVTLTRNAAAEPMVTIPMLDWVGTAGTWPYPCSYPRATFPNQAAFDPDNANCGDGLTPAPDYARIDGADPNLTFVANSLANQQSWVQHVIGAFGASANGGVRYYVLDNEHDLWSDTHHDVVATGPSYTADRDKMILYAAMVKAKDANALIVGPEMSGWIGYVYSPADRDYAPSVNWDSSQFPDRIAMNGSDYAPWLLGQFKAYADAHNGQRLLDFFTVHYYPQGGDNFINTRSLWDPNYVDPSYIGDTIQLIPRLKQWVANNYPGTKIGVTEYNWCDINNEAATDNIGCAIAQADVLGIFGREGLDMATRFNAPIPNLPSYNSMKMYRNYDGSMSTFGDVSTSATVANPDTVAAFAAQRTSDGKLTVLLLSKYAAGNTAATVHLANFPSSGTAQVWQLSGNGSAIQHLADTTLLNSNVALTLPPQSVTLLVISSVQAAPAVSSVSPVSGPAAGGTSVIITGTGFNPVGTTLVTFGGTAATSVTVNSATQITATTAAHTAGAVNVVVTNPDGQTSTLANGYTYVAAAPPPVISTVIPSSGPAVGGTAITITGSGFQGGATVSIGGTAATGVTVVNATQITASTPAHAASTVNVAVTNPDTLTGTLSNGYTYVAAPAVSLSATTINFGAQRMNTSTAASSVTLTNSGTASLTIGSVTVSGSLSETNNCPASLSAGANCVIALAPTALTETPGVLTINDSAADSPQHVSVSGRGDLLITIARPPRPTRSATQTVKTGEMRAGTGVADVPATASAGYVRIMPTFSIAPAPPAAECESSSKKKESATQKRQTACEDAAKPNLDE